jgi:uncharacterized protein YraI
MNLKRLIGIVGCLVLGLAGCNFSRADEDQPTQVSLPVVLVTTPLPTATPTPTETPVPTIPPSFTPAVPTATDTPPATPIPPTVIVPTDPAAAVPTTAAPTSAPAAPAEPSNIVAANNIGAAALVCATCGSLRLRQSPGSAGQIVTYLDASTALNIIGRTADGVWVQVTLADGSSGWVARQYLEIEIDLNAVSVTGVAEDAAVPASGGSTATTPNVISGVSFHARQIYLDGQTKGNRANVFSKVGDSITYTWAFGYPLAGDVNWGDYGHLAPAWRFFAGPNGRSENCFNASPIAAYPGWTTTSVLTPGGAKTGSCGPGETPLECEYRTAQPSVALIMLGTNDVAQNMSTETFRANLQRIVDISISRGVIPVLSTIPPFPTLEGNARAFNEVIVAVARANDIPLWDYYRAINDLPNRGLSADGVHPSESPDNQDANFDADHLQYGFVVRNLGALQMLYELWRQVLYDGGTTPPPADEPPAPQPTTVNIGPVDLASYSCPGAAAVMLTVGGQGRVTPGAPNKVRNAPGLSGTQIGTIPGEAVFAVTGGPHCADGLTWWQVNYNGLIGWTASGTSSENWVEPHP